MGPASVGEAVRFAPGEWQQRWNPGERTEQGIERAEDTDFVFRSPATSSSDADVALDRV